MKTFFGNYSLIILLVVLALSISFRYGHVPQKLTKHIMAKAKLSWNGLIVSLKMNTIDIPLTGNVTEQERTQYQRAVGPYSFEYPRPPLLPPPHPSQLRVQRRGRQTKAFWQLSSSQVLSQVPAIKACPAIYAHGSAVVQVC